MMSFRKSKLDTPMITEIGRGFSLDVKGRVVESVEESFIRLSGSDGLRIEIEAGEWESSLPLDQLTGVALTEMVACRDGSLEILFGNGITGRIASQPYEAWHIRNNASLHIVSVAGGDITIWL